MSPDAKADYEAAMAESKESRRRAQNNQSAAFGDLLGHCVRVCRNHPGANVLTIALSKFSNNLNDAFCGPDFHSDVFRWKVLAALIPLIDEHCHIKLRLPAFVDEEEFWQRADMLNEMYNAKIFGLETLNRAVDWLQKLFDEGCWAMYLSMFRLKGAVQVG